MAEFADDLAVLYAGVAACYISSRAEIPSGDGPYIQITEYGGPEGDYVQQQDSVKYEMPAAQVLVIAATREAALTAWRSCYDLSSKFNATINSTKYVSLRAKQSNPIDLGLDGVGDGRLQFALNVQGERVR